jgi:hypothetical protein
MCHGRKSKGRPGPVKRAAEPYVNRAPRVSVEPKRTSIAFQGDVLDPTASPFGTEPAATFFLPSSANLPKIDAVSGLSAASHRARISMLIEFVNHASLIISSGDVRLISDPWLEGKVFDEGWDRVATSAMTFDDFKIFPTSGSRTNILITFLRTTSRKSQKSIAARYTSCFRKQKTKRCSGFVSVRGSVRLRSCRRKSGSALVKTFRS